MELSDSETELDRLLVAHPPKLIVARADSSSEEEGMDLKQRTGLKGLLANRNKGSVLKEAPKAQVPPVIPPLPHADLRLQVNSNLKKKRPVEDLEEGEVATERCKTTSAQYRSFIVK